MRWLCALLLAGAAAPPGALRAEESAVPDAAAARRKTLLAVAERQRASVVSIQVRTPAGVDSVRQAVVVHADGWLLLAGPTPSLNDTLVARVRPGTYVRALPVARDPETALTLLQVLPGESALQPVSLPPTEPRRPLAAPPTAGTALVMVTAEGAVALGSVRSSDVRRELADGSRGTLVAVHGLLEAALAVLPADLGAPWFDEQGRLVGLLVGGLVSDESVASDFVVRAEPVAAHALPASVASVVWPLLETERRVRRARLGIRTRPASEAALEHLCPTCGGYVVDEVDPEGPAARAALERLDVIVGIEGTALRRHGSLAEALLPFRPLETVRVRVLRRGQPLEREVVLGER